MRVLFISALGESHALALRLMEEGHEIRYFIHSKTEGDIGDGLLNKVKAWQPYVKNSDLIFIDDVEQETDRGKFEGGKIAARLRAAGKKVIGGSPFGDRLENDRLFAQEIFQKAGMKTVPMYRFTSFAAARSFVKKHGGAWALKHNHQVPRDLAGVFWEPGELIGFLEWLEANYKDMSHGKPVDFVLQEAVRGIEIAVTAFFNGKEFLPGTIYVNQEVKKAMNDDEGPPTGQTLEIGRFMDQPKLFHETIAKLTPYLAKEGYCTWFDINCIATRDYIVPLEATARAGYPSVFAFTEGLNMPLGDFLAQAASGQTFTANTTRDWIATVVVAGGTFPYEDAEKNKRLLIKGLEEADWRHVHPNEVRLVNGKFYGAGSMGYVAVVTARGKTIETAATNCYERAKKIHVVPYRKLRTDAGAKAAKDYPRLFEWGWFN